MAPLHTNITATAIKVFTTEYLPGEERIPLVRGSPEYPAVIEAAITLETLEDVEAYAVEIFFKATVGNRIENSVDHSAHLSFDGKNKKLISEDVLVNRKWPLLIPNLIAAQGKKKPIFPKGGNYNRTILVPIDPSWPSSTTGPNLWSLYEISVKILIWDSHFMKPMPLHLGSQVVWVLNSPLNSSGSIPSAAPLTIKDELRIRKDVALPVEVSIPYRQASPGSVVPVTLLFSPQAIQQDLQSSGHLSRQIEYVQFKFLETRVVRNNYKPRENSSAYFEQPQEPDRILEVLKVVLAQGWEKALDVADSTNNKRTVNLTLPNIPSLTPDFKMTYLDVYHTLVVTIQFKSDGLDKEKKAEIEKPMENEKEKKSRGFGRFFEKTKKITSAGVNVGASILGKYDKFKISVPIEIIAPSPLTPYSSDNPAGLENSGILPAYSDPVPAYHHQSSSGHVNRYPSEKN